jgi:hypothetical protein
VVGSGGFDGMTDEGVSDGLGYSAGGGGNRPLPLP